MVSSGPYAQYRVMQLAKGKAKVLLDGQGGDELLAGYVPYQYVYAPTAPRERRLRARRARGMPRRATSSARSCASSSPTGAGRSTRVRSAPSA